MLGFNNTGTFSINGAKRLFFIKQTSIQDIRLNSVGAVEEIAVTEPWALFNNLDDVKFVIKTEANKSGLLFNLELSFTAQLLTRAKSDLFEELVQVPLTCLLQDENDRFWLMAEEYPLRLAAYSASVDGSSNSYSIGLKSKQPKNIKSVAPVFMASLTNISEMIDSNDGYTTQWVINADTSAQTPPASSQIQQLNLLPTVVNPPFGYLIKENDYVVLVGSGKSVLLPSSPKSGQVHIIKDGAGTGHLAPITIDGNGKMIDSSPFFYISTAYGSITLLYSNGQWNTTGFIN